eukprot:3390734-Prymnesium_polylepis.1
MPQVAVPESLGQLLQPGPFAANQVQSVDFSKNKAYNLLRGKGDLGSKGVLGVTAELGRVEDQRVARAIERRLGWRLVDLLVIHQEATDWVMEQSRAVESRSSVRELGNARTAARAYRGA